MKKTIYCALFMLLFLVLRSNGQATNNAFADNQVQVDLISSIPVFAIFSGDVNQDGFIDAFDFLDMDVDIQAGNQGYIPSDLNGDGYTDAFDFLVLDVNVQAGVGLQRPY